MIMEKRGWQKTGKKGSLGVRNTAAAGRPRHNTGGLAFWFIRAERYKNQEQKPYASTRQRCRQLATTQTRPARNKTFKKKQRDSTQSTTK
jgi:hypothetical protein